MSPTHILAILLGRRREALLVFAVVALALFLAASMLPVQYTANASVVLNRKSTDGAVDLPLPGGLLSTHIATQIDILQSERVLLAAIERLGLADKPDWQQRWKGATKEQKPFDVWAAETLSRKLGVKPVSDSSVLTVSYTSTDPANAAAVTNAVIQAYVATILEMRLEPARQYSQYFDERAAVLRDALEASRAKLLAYQRANNLVLTEEKTNLDATRLSELDTRLTQTKLDAEESSARRASAARSPQSMREALGDSVVSALSEELSRQEARLADLSERLAANHPTIIQMSAGIATLKQRRDAAINKILGSIEMADRLSQSQMKGLEKDVKSQRSLVLDTEARRVEARLLEREIESNQRAYDAVLEKASQAALQSGDNQSDISILSTASIPIDRPLQRVAKSLLVSLGGAVLAALLVVMLHEQLDRRLRTVDDITVHLGQHLLVTLPSLTDAASSASALSGFIGTRPAREAALPGPKEA